MINWDSVFMIRKKSGGKGFTIDTHCQFFFLQNADEDIYEEPDLRQLSNLGKNSLFLLSFVVYILVLGSYNYDIWLYFNTLNLNLLNPKVVLAGKKSALRKVFAVFILNSAKKIKISF